MEAEESALQYSLRENRWFCAQLDYLSISSHLIAKSILLDDEHGQILLKADDNAGRMGELVSLLSKWNCGLAFQVFRDAVRLSGELDLQKMLSHDYNLILARVNTEKASECLLVPVILKSIFSYLSTPDLRNARRVCTTWSSTVTACQSGRFKVTFRDYKQLIEFMRTANTSDFCKKIHNFAFCTTDPEPSASWIFHRSFFAEFGKKIFQLELNETLNKDLLRLIFSQDFRPYLVNVVGLKMDTFLPKPVAPGGEESLTTFSNLSTLELTEPSNENAFQELIYFLETFLKNEHHLTRFGLKLTRLRSALYFPQHIIELVFKYRKIEDFRLWGKVGSCMILNDECLDAMTFPDVRQSVLHTTVFPFGQISPRVFNNFLDIHKRTLKTACFYFSNVSSSFALMHGIPCLESLESLKLLVTCNHVGWNSLSSLSFVNKFKNLRTLNVSGFGQKMYPPASQSPQFQHFGLRNLEFKIKDSTIGKGTWILAFIPFIPCCFPNLTSFELLINTDSVNWAWPGILGHLTLEPQSTDGYGFCQDKVRWVAAPNY